MSNETTKDINNNVARGVEFYVLSGGQSPSGPDGGGDGRGGGVLRIMERFPWTNQSTMTIV